MARLILAVLIAAMLAVAVKVALVAACLVCLVFKPKETVGVLLGLGALALIRNYTLACLLVAAVLIAVAGYQRRQSI